MLESLGLPGCEMSLLSFGNTAHRFSHGVSGCWRLGDFHVDVGAHMAGKAFSADSLIIHEKSVGDLLRLGWRFFLKVEENELV